MLLFPHTAWIWIWMTKWPGASSDNGFFDHLIQKKLNFMHGLKSAILAIFQKSADWLDWPCPVSAALYFLSQDIFFYFLFSIFYFLFSISFFFKFETIFRGSIWSFGHSNYDPSSVSSLLWNVRDSRVASVQSWSFLFDGSKLVRFLRKLFVGYGVNGKNVGSFKSAKIWVWKSTSNVKNHLGSVSDNYSHSIKYYSIGECFLLF